MLILTSLADGEKHGYALGQDIEAFAGIRLQPATLYSALRRLEAGGLVQPLPEIARRRPYRITTAGKEALKTDLAAKRHLVDIALTRLERQAPRVGADRAQQSRAQLAHTA